MSIHSKRELEVTREKLRRLEEHYAKRQLQPADDEHVRQLSLRSLKQVMNQLREEIVRFEAHFLSQPRES